MQTVDDVLAELRRIGNEATRRTLLRHGAPDNTYGVKIADLKRVAKQIKGNHELACRLYESGNYDAMYLAGIVADGRRMNKKQLESWVKTAPCGMISEYTVPGVTVESPHARELAQRWIRSKNEAVASSGWSTYVGILATSPDSELDKQEIEGLLNQVVDQIHKAPNRVRYVMNSFVISVGAYFKPLLSRAKRAAKTIGVVSIDMGDTACKVPVALPYIEKIEAAGRVGKKRKTFKC